MIIIFLNILPLPCDPGPDLNQTPFIGADQSNRDDFKSSAVKLGTKMVPVSINRVQVTKVPNELTLLKVS